MLAVVPRYTERVFTSERNGSGADKDTVNYSFEEIQ